MMGFRLPRFGKETSNKLRESIAVPRVGYKMLHGTGILTFLFGLNVNVWYTCLVL